MKFDYTPFKPKDYKFGPDFRPGSFTPGEFTPETFEQNKFDPDAVPFEKRKREPINIRGLLDQVKQKEALTGVAVSEEFISGLATPLLREKAKENIELEESENKRRFLERQQAFSEHSFHEQMRLGAYQTKEGHRWAAFALKEGQRFNTFALRESQRWNEHALKENQRLNMFTFKETQRMQDHNIRQGFEYSEHARLEGYKRNDWEFARGVNYDDWTFRRGEHSRDQDFVRDVGYEEFTWGRQLEKDEIDLGEAYKRQDFLSRQAMDREDHYALKEHELKMYEIDVQIQQSDLDRETQRYIADNSGGGRVICTELNRQGFLPDYILKLDNQHCDKYIDKETYIGYLLWAVPVVKLMKRFKLITQLVRPIAVSFSYECAHIMDKQYKGSILGRLVMKFGIPICRKYYKYRLNKVVGEVKSWAY